MAAKPYNKSLFAFSFDNNSEAIADTLDEIITLFESFNCGLPIDVAINKGLIDFISYCPISTRNKSDIVWLGEQDN